jgi:hypothetical protein
MYRQQNLHEEIRGQPTPLLTCREEILLPAAPVARLATGDNGDGLVALELIELYLVTARLGTIVG